MNERIDILRFEIDGRWTAEDMALSLFHIRDLYNLRLVLQIQLEDWRSLDEFWFEMSHFPPFQKIFKRRMIHPSMFPFLYPHMPIIPSDSKELSKLAAYLYPHEQLEIHRIEYGSPGFKDLTGLGDIVGHVKDFVLKLIEYWVDREKRKLDNEERDLKNERLRIENARAYVQLAKECGYTESEIRKLTSWVDERQETFINLIWNDKLKNVYLHNKNKDLNK